MNKDLILRLMTIVMTVSSALIPAACKKSDGPGTTTIPLAVTYSASWLGPKWATLNGQVTGKGYLTTVTFQFDTITNYSHILKPSPDTTSGIYATSFSYTVTDLKPKTKYHFRINGTSTGGTGNGSDLFFTTTDTSKMVISFNPGLLYDSIYDSEGNKYKTIVIGAQTWMAENLRSVKLNDGTNIPFVPEINKWTSLITPGYCWYNGDSTGYGAIYNWYTVNTGKLCPEGWHVPSDVEWTELTDFLGGLSVAGGLLKETGLTHWISPNTGASNESGFTGVPTGYRSYSGTFNSTGRYSYWWTSTELSPTGAWYRDVYYGYDSVDRSNGSKKTGANLRCVKD